MNITLKSQYSRKLVLLLLLLFFVGTNVKEHGRLAKKRQVWSNSRQREKADNMEMVVLPRETLLEILRRKV